MIQNSFIQLPGIGEKKEISIWNDGVFSWGDYIKNKKESGVKIDENKSLIQVQKCLSNLAKNQVDYFYNALPSSEEWRLFREFKNHCLYLDIETNGGDSFSGYITTIATYDGSKIKYYVNGKNLDDFIIDVFDYKILITYNGKSFDIPFIQNYFNVELNHAQIDLRYTLASLGFKGGLKSCEQQLGLRRKGLDGVDGYFAIHLWNDYYYNANQKALESLLAYNIEDSINLEKLMQISYNMKIDNLGFENFEKVPNCRTPSNIFQPHFETISKIKSKTGYNY
ncbi:MAG: exonuclease [Candidatus Marinimicrobia bacterium]|nr:exonuclease [Candidatus Neomarinimicrobiota bacterium]